jgi:hypothetical protein
MTNLHALLLGMLLAWVPSLIVFAFFLLRAPEKAVSEFLPRNCEDGGGSGG